MTIRQLLKSRREALGYTLEDVAQAVGVSRATVSRWESGDIHKMKPNKISALSAILGIDPVLLTYPEELLTADERHLLTAYRRADDRARADALHTLESHPKG